MSKDHILFLKEKEHSIREALAQEQMTLAKRQNRESARLESIIGSVLLKASSNSPGPAAMLKQTLARESPVQKTDRRMIHEANRQFIEAASRLCYGFPGAELAVFQGLIAAWRNTPVPISNAIFLANPITDERDLELRSRALAAYIRSKNRPPTFIVCRDWIPDALRAAADDQIAAAGLVPSTTITGMAADELVPATRRLDVSIDWRRVSDEQTRRDFADVNAAGNGLPIEFEREALGLPQVWSNDGLAGYVGYIDDGRPITAAAVMALNGALHALCVATHPAHQRRGFAARTIRYALDQMHQTTGLTRSTLSATQAGLPVYLRLGYREVSTFVVYTRDVKPTSAKQD
jgi:GNAT superfamily N-acetyltransferase